jgi:hypothetical protein
MRPSRARGLPYFQFPRWAELGNVRNFFTEELIFRTDNLGPSYIQFIVPNIPGLCIFFPNSITDE